MGRPATDTRPSRPIGWWIKEADARIDAAFARAFERSSLDRRRWQILTTLTRAPARPTDLAGALARFDAGADVRAVVADLIGGGLVRETGDGRVELTVRGTRVQQEAAAQLDVVRQQVGAALGADGYVQLIDLLAQLIDALPDPGVDSEPAGPSASA